MNSLGTTLARILRLSAPNLTSSLGNVALGVKGSAKLFYSTGSFDSNNDNEGNNDDVIEVEDDDFLPEKPELHMQMVDPRKGWNYRGVHKAIICGKIGQSPVQKILRSGRTVTLFTVGTGGMFDQRIARDNKPQKPAQWHRIAVHNDALGAYAVRQLVKNSSVYVEGDIETRVYNDSIIGQIKNVPEICVRRDGRVRLIKAGETANNIPIDELREELL